ncbi:hypothetical protein C2E23DRAFT_461073 [Lenzites betulinus]|nr:hypothetical protein C2E23DRAFT_461073 [Lenzites betulinus]
MGHRKIQRRFTACAKTCLVQASCAIHPFNGPPCDCQDLPVALQCMIDDGCNADDLIELSGDSSACGSLIKTSIRTSAATSLSFGTEFISTFQPATFSSGPFTGVQISATSQSISQTPSVPLRTESATSSVPSPSRTTPPARPSSPQSDVVSLRPLPPLSLPTLLSSFAQIFTSSSSSSSSGSTSTAGATSSDTSDNTAAIPATSSSSLAATATQNHADFVSRGSPTMAVALSSSLVLAILGAVIAIAAFVRRRRARSHVSRDAGKQMGGRDAPGGVKTEAEDDVPACHDPAVSVFLAAPTTGTGTGDGPHRPCGASSNSSAMDWTSSLAAAPGTPLECRPRLVRATGSRTPLVGGEAGKEAAGAAQELDDPPAFALDSPYGHMPEDAHNGSLPSFVARQASPAPVHPAQGGQRAWRLMTVLVEVGDGGSEEGEGSVAESLPPYRAASAGDGHGRQLLQVAGDVAP